MWMWVYTTDECEFHTNVNCGDEYYFAVAHACSHSFEALFGYCLFPAMVILSVAVLVFSLHVLQIAVTLLCTSYVYCCSVQ